VSGQLLVKLQTLLFGRVLAQRTINIDDAEFAQPVFEASDAAKHVFAAHNIAGVEIVERFAGVMKRVQSIKLPLPQIGGH
jgi:hypothetical protein